MNKPYFLTVEGIEGAGKSTAVTFLHQRLKQAHISHQVTREPGGTEIAEEIRRMLLHKNYQEPMSKDTELLMMFASRAQHLERVIRPALALGKWVICDRFTEATYAYQGGGRGVPMDRIKQIEHWVQGDLRPDRILLLDIPVIVGQKRIVHRSQEDRIEQEKTTFFERVRQGYLERAQQYPERYRVIDGSQTLPQVEMQLLEVLDELLCS